MKNETSGYLGENFRTIRRLHGKTLADTARRLQISAGYLSRLEQGRRPVPPEIRSRFCRVFFIATHVIDGGPIDAMLYPAPNEPAK